MSITVYYHPLSQPSRAIVLFCRLNKIKHETKVVDFSKEEHKSPEYTAIQPSQVVPAIKDGDFCLGESTAIVRYLAAKYKVADHWYPADLKARARVDAYLAWQHTGLRKAGCDVMINEVFTPRSTGKKDQEAVDKYVKTAEETIGKMNKIFLKGQKFLCGEEISIADLFAICELIQPLSCPSGKGLLKNQPEITEWMKRVEAILNPDYDEMNKQLKMTCEQA
ncbi:glutathione S-transferase theta-1-like [Anneissia japonica]|uniref:glutathione S-transferase theta-1-like n=1 Tax=Anneissia japonica TaxID=1529436 RepID=UPI001425745C|nr:glutathione S-transferase theta-1-like [Anneissia japonica]